MLLTVWQLVGCAGSNCGQLLPQLVYSNHATHHPAAAGSACGKLLPLLLTAASCARLLAAGSWTDTYSARG